MVSPNSGTDVRENLARRKHDSQWVSTAIPASVKDVVQRIRKGERLSPHRRWSRGRDPTLQSVKPIFGFLKRIERSRVHLREQVYQLQRELSNTRDAHNRAPERVGSHGAGD